VCVCVCVRACARACVCVFGLGKVNSETSAKISRQTDLQMNIFDNLVVSCMTYLALIGSFSLFLVFSLCTCFFRGSKLCVHFFSHIICVKCKNNNNVLHSV
jgi:hypothetical protein